MMLWCRTNTELLEIDDFATLFEPREILFGEHQTTTCGNGREMLISRAMFCCEPDNNFVDNTDLVKS